VLVDALARAGRISDEHVDAIVASLLTRERFATTAMGNGLAFPHLRSRSIEQICGAVGVAPSGIDFDSLDQLPTRLVLLTLSPFEQRSDHCQVLGRLTCLLSDRTLEYSLRTSRPVPELFTLLNLA
jgi:mannitol/fructose-specific phosphotransferase system IIA component (Ntr-type)